MECGLFITTLKTESKIRTKKEAGLHIKHLKDITTENFTFQQCKLAITNPLKIYQSIRHANPSCLTPSHRGHTTPCKAMTQPNQLGRAKIDIKRKTIIGTRPKTPTSRANLTQDRVTRTGYIATSGVQGNIFPLTKRRKKRYLTKPRTSSFRTTSIPRN